MIDNKPFNLIASLISNKHKISIYSRLYLELLENGHTKTYKRIRLKAGVMIIKQKKLA